MTFSRTEGRMNAMTAVFCGGFFFFALTSYLIVCGKVQKNYTTNTFSTRLPDKRSGPQEETALNKVKR